MLRALSFPARRSPGFRCSLLLRCVSGGYGGNLLCVGQQRRIWWLWGEQRGKKEAVRTFPSTNLRPIFKLSLYNLVGFNWLYKTELKKEKVKKWKPFQELIRQINAFHGSQVQHIFHTVQRPFCLRQTSQLSCYTVTFAFSTQHLIQHITICMTALH